MMEKIVILLTILIGGGISLVFLMGKGSFLIAGYNTASEKERRKYNEKKLCRTVGAYMALITVLVLGAELLGENIPDWYLALVMGGVFIGLIPTLLYANLGCKVKPGEEIPLEDIVNHFLKFAKECDLSESIIKEVNNSSKIFEEMDVKDKDYLQTVGLITMLSYDTFVRKILIEKLIDSLPDVEKDKE